MKLDPKAMRYLTSEDFRVLAAVCPSIPAISHLSANRSSAG